ncbi:MAG TPA: acyltransferase [Candidatus Angelobacter sp.]|nr:acyltransferase [Candidatus Angelobacter sp.]
MKAQSGYIPTLDGWRASAILGVILAHSLRGLSDTSLHGMTPDLVRLGQNGVSIFFGLSGFLISVRLLEEFQKTGSISLKRFYLRRAFRILPPALVYLVLLGALGWLVRLAISPGEWASSMFFARNYVPVGAGLGFYTEHFWSLAVEEHFYLLWPILLAALGQRQLRWIVPILIAAVSIWRNIEFHHGYLAALLPGVEPSQRTDVRVDSLLCGCMVALLMQIPEFREWSKRILQWPVFMLLGGCYLALVMGWVNLHLSALLAASICPVLIVATVLHPQNFAGRLLEWLPFRWIGRLSYSLYLWQQLFIIGFVKGASSLEWLQKFPVNLAALVLIALASYYLIERPLIRLGHRLATPATEGRDDLAGTAKSYMVACNS